MKKILPFYDLAASLGRMNEKQLCFVFAELMQNK